MLPSFLPLVAIALVACLLHSSWGFNSPLPRIQQRSSHHEARSEIRLNAEKGGQQQQQQSFLENNTRSPASRRGFFASVASSTVLATALLVDQQPAHAASKATADATVTDKIFIEFKGLSAPGEPNDRITIGLFGNDAPQPVSILKQVVTKGGYKSKCKPLDTSRTFEKEQLEANKVYNSCMETEDTNGVNYEYSSVWRVVKDERIDVGAVSGKFIARENPNFEDAQSGLTHDAPGVVSVRRGNEGGYSFVISPVNSNRAAASLDEDNIVVGRIIEGMDVVDKLNAVPVVKSGGLNYKALTGGEKTRNAPSRGCRYGGSEYYCSEDKPLKKVLLDKTGLL